MACSVRLMISWPSAKYPKHARDVIHDAVVYGTGVVKGPVPMFGTTKRWTQQDGAYVLSMERKPLPEAARVDLWNFFPDMSATHIREAEFVFERHYSTKQQASALQDMPDDTDALREAAGRAAECADEQLQEACAPSMARPGPRTADTRCGNTTAPLMRQTFLRAAVRWMMTRSDLHGHRVVSPTAAWCSKAALNPWTPTSIRTASTHGRWTSPAFSDSACPMRYATRRRAPTVRFAPAGQHGPVREAAGGGG